VPQVLAERVVVERGVPPAGVELEIVLVLAELTTVPAAQVRAGTLRFQVMVQLIEATGRVSGETPMRLPGGHRPAAPGQPLLGTPETRFVRDLPEPPAGVFGERLPHRARAGRQHAGPRHLEPFGHEHVLSKSLL
jgi:hypothetical protein